MQEADLQFVANAVQVLERPGFLLKVSSYLGRPVTIVTEKLPTKVQGVITSGVDRALKAGLKLAIASLDSAEAVELPPEAVAAKKWTHTAAAMGLGAASGLTGGLALIVELPLTTTVIMRSIASMARASGFNPADPKTALEILTVFAYGSPLARGTASLGDSTFFMQRAALDVLIRDGAKFIAGKSATQVLTAVEKGAAPRLVELLARIAARMNLIAGEKFLAQSLPLLGAAGGAAINGLFNDYYSNIAYYAFGLKRLEQKYGQDAVREAYDAAVKKLA